MATPAHPPAKSNPPSNPHTAAQSKHESKHDEPKHEHEDPKTIDPTGKKDQYGRDPSVNTKPPDQGGGDQSPHPSPITDPTNAMPEPLQWTEDNPRPPLAKPGTRDYVAGQPVDQAEYDKTEKEAADRVRPEAWERAKAAMAEQGISAEYEQAGPQHPGTRPDGRPLRDPNVADDDVNKAPGGAGGQGTRADGRARAPDASLR
jgi:hypothetical protein